jgi:SAM-dependent methyltransferase
MPFSPSAILDHPSVYNFFQRAVGAHRVRELSIDALAPLPGDRILDVGCGPAYYMDRLPSCDYHGFDTDSAYIAYARRRFGSRGRFHDQPYTEEHRAALEPFDRVMLMGLLHHLDDDACHALLDLVARSLAPGGRVVTLDTVLFEGQSRLSRLLARNDRGAFVRSPAAFLALANQHFGEIEQRSLGDTWRIPSAHFLMSLSDPHPSATR